MSILASQENFHDELLKALSFPINELQLTINSLEQSMSHTKNIMRIFFKSTKLFSEPRYA